MRYNVGKIVVKKKNNSWRSYGLALVTSTFIVAGLMSPVYATDSAVQVKVQCNQSNPCPTLSLDNISSTQVISSPTLVITGTELALNQIQVFVDGQQVSIIPLDQSSTTFSYNLVVTPGTHTVVFVGIDSNGPGPTVSFTVKYTPPTQPQVPQQTIQQGSAQTGVVVGEVGEGLTISPNQKTSSLNPTQYLPSGLVGALIFLDFITPGNPSDLGIMFLRFLLILTALVVFFLARPLLAAYRKVRYGWLNWRKRPMPDIIRQHPLATLRLIGLSIAILVVCIV